MASRDALGHRQRNMASNIFDGADAPVPNYKVPVQQISTVFENEANNQSNVARREAGETSAPPPFLTDMNAVNNKGRRGGFVNQSDSLIEAGEYSQEEIDAYYLQQESPVNGNESVQYNERNGHDRAVQEDQINLNNNTDKNNAVAKGHKQRQMTSNIFDSPQAHEQVQQRPDYKRGQQISNVF